jgi:hypothetical protein
MNYTPEFVTELQGKGTERYAQQSCPGTSLGIQEDDKLHYTIYCTMHAFVAFVSVKNLFFCPKRRTETDCTISIECHVAEEIVTVQTVVV